MSDKVFYCISAGFVSGVFISSFLKFGFAFAGLFFVIGVAIFAYAKMANENNEKLKLIALLVFFIGAGILRMEFVGLRKDAIALDRVLGEKVILFGTVASEPDLRENKTRLIVDVGGLMEGKNVLKIKTKILTSTDIFSDLKYGDGIKITGTVSRPENFSAENSDRVFDYRSYLAKDGIFYIVNYAKIEKNGENAGNFFVHKLYDFKENFLANIKKVIPEPGATLAGGLLLGGKGSLGKKLNDDFRKAGIIHVVVLSGYNITIVAETIMKMSRFIFPHLGSMFFGTIGIIMFAIIAGGGATVVRASIMALLVILARSTSRTYDITRALVLAGFFMILQNPNVLVFDASFELSFLATVSLIYLAPIIEEKLKWIPEKMKFREIIVSTISTQIFVLPMLLYLSGNLSFVAIFTNLLILGFVPITMFFGALTGFVGFVSSFLSLPFAYISHLFLSYELFVVDKFANLPFAATSIPYFPWWAVLGCYAIFMIIIFSRHYSSSD